MAWDVLIRGATVFDGTGSPPHELDLAVQGDRIAFIGKATDQRAQTELDARGLVVAPGFIDIHTHSDMSLLIDGRGQSKVSQGVTTDVTGNCGFSPFPINPEHLALHLDLLAGIGDEIVELVFVRAAFVQLVLVVVPDHGAILQRRLAVMPKADGLGPLLHLPIEQRDEAHAPRRPWRRARASESFSARCRRCHPSPGHRSCRE